MRASTDANRTMCRPSPRSRAASTCPLRPKTAPPRVTQIDCSFAAIEHRYLAGLAVLPTESCLLVALRHMHLALDSDRASLLLMMRRQGLDHGARHALRRPHHVSFASLLFRVAMRFRRLRSWLTLFLIRLRPLLAGCSSRAPLHVMQGFDQRRELPRFAQPGRAKLDRVQTAARYASFSSAASVPFCRSALPSCRFAVRIRPCRLLIWSHDSCFACLSSHRHGPGSVCVGHGKRAVLFSGQETQLRAAKECAP